MGEEEREARKEAAKQEAKSQMKRKIKRILWLYLKKFIIIGLAIIVGIALIAAAYYWLTTDHDVTENPNDPKNGPAAVRSYLDSIEIDEDGKLVLSKTPKEEWEDLKKQGNRITDYLSSAKEFTQFINAQIASEFPCMDPDKTVEWEELKTNSKKVSGIVKIKRKTYNEKEYYMKYISPEKFQKYVESGNSEAYKYFTLEKQLNTNASGENTVNDGSINEIQKKIVESATNGNRYGAAGGYCQMYVEGVYRAARY